MAKVLASTAVVIVAAAIFLAFAAFVTVSF